MSFPEQNINIDQRERHKPKLATEEIVRGLQTLRAFQLAADKQDNAGTKEHGEHRALGAGKNPVHPKPEVVVDGAKFIQHGRVAFRHTRKSEPRDVHEQDAQYGQTAKDVKHHNAFRLAYRRGKGQIRLHEREF